MHSREFRHFSVDYNLLSIIYISLRHHFGSREGGMSILAHYCPLLQKIPFEYDFIGESMYEFIQLVAPSLEYSIVDCIWILDKNCVKYITPVLTDDGLCFTFNALNSHDIYTDE